MPSSRGQSCQQLGEVGGLCDLPLGRNPFFDDSSRILLMLLVAAAFRSTIEGGVSAT